MASTLAAISLLPASASASLARFAVSAASERSAYVPGQLLVRYRSGVENGERDDLRRRHGARLVRELPLSGLELVGLDPGASVPKAIEAFEREPAVRYAAPNYIRHSVATPDDTYLDYEWALSNTGQAVPDTGGGWTAGTPDADIDAPEAWNVTTGADNVTVAVVDSGVDTYHADLAPNTWLNAGESGGNKETNGFDDDANGYADDWQGWDWVDSDDDPFDENGHGTHVAGIVGARGNDATGVAGVMWRTQLQALRVLDANGDGTDADIIAAFSYAQANGARVTNASFGGPDYSQPLKDAIAASPGVLFVTAAGNEGTNNDALPAYPCNFDLSNLLCVAATDQNDGLARFTDGSSNYGAVSVDLAAPGTNILSTFPWDEYAIGEGTSMATPFVAGAAGLLLARDPGLTAAALRNGLLGSVDPLPSLSGKVASGGRLNLARALSGSTGEPGSTSSPATTNVVVNSSTTSSSTQSGTNTSPSADLAFPPPGSTVKRRRLRSIRGTVTGAPDAERVRIALQYRRGRRCYALTSKGLRRRGCSRRVFLTAKGTDAWSYRLSQRQRRTLRPGTYRLTVRIIGPDGAQIAAEGDTRATFTIRG